MKACTQPPNYVANADDCATTDPYQPQVLFQDIDDDSHGNPAITTIDCGVPNHWATAGDDCDDLDSGVFTGATEVCDYKDNDCDGPVDDEQDNIGAPLYPDGDSDGYGDDTSTSVGQACWVAPPGMTFLQGDCDDTDPELNPDTEWFDDLDGDGYGQNTVAAVQCSRPTPDQIRVPGDCDDTSVLAAQVHPGALERCNTYDDDCDTMIDDEDDSFIEPIWYQDSDLDGYGDPASQLMACTQPATHVSNLEDCDDTDPSLYNGQTLIVVAGTGYPSITSAVAAACDGGVIRVAPQQSPYVEDITLDSSKRLTIEAYDPYQVPVIRGATGHAFTLDGTLPGTVLRDLDVEAPSTYAMLLKGGATAQLERVAFNGAGLELDGSDVKVIEGSFSQCGGSGFGVSGGGAKIWKGSTAEFLGSFTLNNAADGGALWIDGSSVLLASVQVEDNLSTNTGAGIRANAATLVMTEMAFLNNSPHDLYATDSDVDLDVSEHSQSFGGLYIESSGAPHTATLSHLTMQAMGGSSGEAMVTLQGAGLTSTLQNSSLYNSPITPGVVLNGGQHTLAFNTIVDVGGALQLQGVTDLNLDHTVLYTSLDVNDGRTGGLSQGSWNHFLSSADVPGPFGTNSSSGDPQFITYFSTLDPNLWILYPTTTSPLFQDNTDGQDRGASGGPLGDHNDWYNDTDGDTLWDGWEDFWFFKLLEPGTSDYDNDTLTNFDEQLDGTNPNSQDTDGDGCKDQYEVTYGTQLNSSIQADGAYCPPY